ncbi:hypothetical protein [Corynebacterium striatum]|uniref:hypothetical protein n=1 Tax=Corynebacterium striatum TaxID=43770 RepID=UPI00066827A3|nr:hypothetical protein [Corynebacterium striatum]MDK8826746.1 hypothetical protein [Corynebacterium striatum]
MLATAVNSAQDRGLIPADRDGFLAIGSAPMTCTPTVTVRITVRIMRAVTRKQRGAEPAATDHKETLVAV